jgi:NitT/TauT family transport system permease protein
MTSHRVTTPAEPAGNAAQPAADTTELTRGAARAGAGHADATQAAAVDTADLAAVSSAGPAPGRGRLSRLHLTYAVSLVAGIAIWWLLAATVYASQHTLPTPPQVVSAARQLAGSGELWGNIAASFFRVLAGFVLGVLVAIPVGFLTGWYWLARGVVEPWIQFFRTIPPLALTPMVIVFFGIGETAKVLLIFLAAFLSTVIATFQGVRGVDVMLIKAARVLGANDWVIFRRVAVPASLPYIFTGARIGLGSSWATLVAAELVAGGSGLGYLMQTEEQYYDTGAIVVAIICIGVLGFVMDRILLVAESRLTGWQERREA